MNIENYSIIFRKATIQDIESLVNLRKFLLSEGTGHYVSRNNQEEVEWQDSYRKWLKTKLYNSDTILVAVGQLSSDDDICACAIAIIDERAPLRGCLNGRMGWAQTVVVHPSQRRRGIAKKIMNYILEWLKSNDVSKVILQTTPTAKDLYEKIGFINSGEDLLWRII